MFVYIRATPLTLKRLDSCEQVDSSLSPKTNNNFPYNFFLYRIFSVPFACLPTKTKPKQKPTTFSSAIFFSFYDGFFLYIYFIYKKHIRSFSLLFFFTFYFIFLNFSWLRFPIQRLLCGRNGGSFKHQKEIPENV